MVTPTEPADRASPSRNRAGSLPSHALIARQIGVAIVTGDFEPGSVLANEVALAEKLHVSRSVVREALRTLASKGLVEGRKKAGTSVRPRTAWNLLDPELLRWMFEGAPPLSFVRNLFQLRMIVEPAAAELAARDRTPQQLAGMGHAIAEMERHSLASEAGRAADRRFHTLILEATGNELLMSLSASIAAAVQWTTFFKYRVASKPRDPLPEHQALFDAIARSDPAAARVATETLLDRAGRDTEAAIEIDARITRDGSTG